MRLIFILLFSILFKTAESQIPPIRLIAEAYLNGERRAINQKGKFISSYQLDPNFIKTSFNSEISNSNPMMVWKDNKYGFCNYEGELKADFLYDDAKYFQHGSTPVKIRDKWGIINGKGVWQVQPKYMYAGNQGKERLALLIDTTLRAGFVNWAGELKIPFKYFADPNYCDWNFNMRRFAVVDPQTGMIGFIDPGGKVAIPFQYSYYRTHPYPRFDDNGFCHVYYDSTLIVIDTSGKEIYRYEGRLFNNAAGVVMSPKSTYETAFFLPDGKRIVPNVKGVLHPNRIWGNLNSELSLMVVCGVDEDEMFNTAAFMNAAGLNPFNKVFQEAWPFSEGLAQARTEKGWGYIDSKGNWVIKPQFDNASSFEEGLALVWTYTNISEGKWRFINRAGKFEFKESFEDALPFRNNLAAVKKNGRWGYIDRNGEWEIEPKFERAFQFLDLDKDFDEE